MISYCEYKNQTSNCLASSTFLSSESLSFSNQDLQKLKAKIFKFSLKKVTQFSGKLITWINIYTEKLINQHLHYTSSFPPSLSPWRPVFPSGLWFPLDSPTVAPHSWPRSDSSGDQSPPSILQTPKTFNFLLISISNS